MKHILMAVLVMVSAVANGQVISAGQPAVYIGQTFNATSASADAVNVNRYDTVKFIGCIFNGLLRGSGGSNIVDIGCIHNGIAPVGNEQWNRAIDVYMPQALYVYNSTFNHTAGIRVDHRNENTKRVVISHSRFYNIDARNGYGQYNGSQRAAILIDGCVGINGEISWNYIYNAPDSSCVEDNINLRNSGGYVGRPFPVTKNYIDGAYSWPVSLTTIPSVSGITIETGDETAYEKVSQFVRVDSNYIVRCMNGGINMTSTHDVSSTGNTVVSSGKLPDGRQSYAFWSVLAIWNGSSLPATTWVRNTQTGNRIALVRPGGTNGGVNRNDVSTPETIPLSDNYHIPNPITKATEDSVLIAWVADTLRAAGKVVVTAPTTTIVTTDSTIKQGATVTGSIRPVNATGGTAIAKDNSVLYKSGSTAIFTVAKDATNQLAFTVKAVKVGRSILTISYTNNAGETVTATYPVNVVYSEPPGVGMEMKLNQ